MNQGDDQNLWHLLGRSERPAAPPFFAAKVLRLIEARPHATAWRTPLLRWFAPAAVAALLILAVLPRPEPVSSTGDLTTLDLVEMLSPEDYEILTTAGWPYDNSSLTAGL